MAKITNGSAGELMTIKAYRQSIVSDITKKTEFTKDKK